jgi:hypothetical protein
MLGYVGEREPLLTSQIGSPERSRILMTIVGGRLAVSQGSTEAAYAVSYRNDSVLD